MLGVVTDGVAATGIIAASRLLGAALVVLLVAVTVSCGGGDGTAIATGTSSTRTTRTLTTPTITTPTRTAPPASTEGEAAELPAATTAPPATTTPPATTVVTVTEPAITQTTPAATVTVTETETVTAAYADDSFGDRYGHTDGDDRGCAGALDGHDDERGEPGRRGRAAAAAAASEEDDELGSSEWGWIAFGVLALAVAVGGVVWWLRKRSSAKKTDGGVPPAANMPT